MCLAELLLCFKKKLHVITNTFLINSVCTSHFKIKSALIIELRYTQVVENQLMLGTEGL